MRWTAIQGGELGSALLGAGRGALLEVIARVDLAMPPHDGAPCRLVDRATDGPAWEGAAPADGRARVTLRGSRPAAVTLVAAGREALHAAFEPGTDRRLDLEGPALRGDERLLVAVGRAPLRALQLPGLAPHVRAAFPDGTEAPIPLSGVGIDLDLDRDRVSLFWRGTVAMPRAARDVTLDAVDLRARVAPALPIAPAVVELRPPPLSPACATPIDDDSGLVATTFPWRLRPPREARIVVVKGTFDMVEGAPARRAAEQDPLAGESTGEAPYPGDFSPFKPRADVLLRGQAYPRPGATTAHVELTMGALSAKVAAGLAPIPRAAAARAAKAGSYGEAWLASRWPHFPEDFDWAHENAAPAELTAEHLRGDERYRVTSVVPGGGDLHGQLPGVRPRCFAEHAGGAITEVPLRLDTAVLDAERRKVVLVWRGALEGDGEIAIQRFLIVDEPLDAPRSLDAIRRRLATRRGPETPEPSAPALIGEIRAALSARRPLPGAAAPAVRAAPGLVPTAPRVTRRQVERWLEAGEPLAGRDLSGVDLSGIDLSGRDLSGAILGGAILDDARLDGARCDGLTAVGLRARRSTWKGARLARANLARADLSLADLSGAVLTQASLADAELAGLVANKAEGASVQLVRARLTGASLEEAQLDHADLSGATLDGVRLTGAVLDDARLYEVLGEGIAADRASLADARFEAARLDRASFRGARARGSMWEGAALAGADFTGADLAEAGFAGAGLARARFGGADLSGARLRLAALAGASFVGADLMRADLSGADAAGADFTGANLYQAETGPGRLAGAKLAGAFLKGTKLA